MDKRGEVPSPLFGDHDFSNAFVFQLTDRRLRGGGARERARRGASAGSPARCSPCIANQIDPCLLELNHVDCLARRQYRREVMEYDEHYTDSAHKQLASDKMRLGIQDASLGIRPHQGAFTGRRAAKRAGPRLLKCC